MGLSFTSRLATTVVTAMRSRVTMSMAAEVQHKNKHKVDDTKKQTHRKTHAHKVHVQRRQRREDVL